MAENWKPGDVAVMDALKPDVRIFCYEDLTTGDLEWVSADEGGAYPGPSSPARRLVVIDPEDREQVERLYVEYVSAAGVVDNGYVDEMQAALREFANPTPPKPDEPTGHLAVVIDTDGNRWVNWRDLRDDMDHERPWVLASDGFTYRDYADIDVAEIKWEGIQ